MVNYWLFIIPEKHYPDILWEKCVKDNVLAMEYLIGETRSKRNIDLIKSIKKNDFVVAYLNEKRVGGIGKVEKEYFDAEMPYEDCGIDGYRQRIGVEWVFVKDHNYPTINYNKIFGNMKINSATIHKLNKTQYSNFLSISKNDWLTIVLQKDGFTKKFDVFENRKQIILYGPPGTGKTYKAREYAVNLIQKSILEE